MIIQADLWQYDRLYSHFILELRTSTTKDPKKDEVIKSKFYRTDEF